MDMPMVGVCIPFGNHQEFVAYFKNKNEVMRSLLCQYTRVKTVDEALKMPNYQRKAQSPETTIEEAFFSTFI